MKEKGKEVIYDAEHFFDGYQANPEYALATVKTAAISGADCVVLCDTNGGSLPWEIEEIVSAGRPELERWRAETIEEALSMAQDLARARGMTVLVAGGLFLAVEAAESLEGRNPRDLRFF